MTSAIITPASSSFTGRRLRLLTAVWATIGLMTCNISAAREQDPEKLVSKLGASGYKEREESMKALAAMGYKARPSVRNALNSPDPEIQSRANELWKTLKWLVSSNITAESIQPLLCYSNKPAVVDYRYYQQRAMLDPFAYSAMGYGIQPNDNIDIENWKSFIEKNKEQTLALLAEMNKDPQYQSTYRGAIRLCIDNLGPETITSAINKADQQTRAEFIAMFSDLNITYSANSNTFANALAILNNLNLYDKAFESGKMWFQASPQENIIEQCATAAKSGKLEEKIWKDAAVDVTPSMGNPNIAAIRMAFYAGLARKTGNPKAFSSLKKPQKFACYDKRFTQSLFDSLLDMKLYDELLNLTTGNSTDPVTVYYRAACFKAMGKSKDAENEWQNACKALDVIPNKEAATMTTYMFADFLENKKDKEAETLWLKVIDKSVSNSVYHANSCFRLARHAERKEDLATAVDYYERGITSSRMSGGVITATIGIDNKVTTEDDIRQHIAMLRERISRKK